MTVFPMNLPFKSPKRQINIRFFHHALDQKMALGKKLPYGDGLSTDVSVPRTYGDEIDDLHFAIVCGT